MTRTDQAIFQRIGSVTNFLTKVAQLFGLGLLYSNMSVTWGGGLKCEQGLASPLRPKNRSILGILYFLMSRNQFYKIFSVGLHIKLDAEKADCTQ